MHLRDDDLVGLSSPTQSAKRRRRRRRRRSGKKARLRNKPDDADVERLVPRVAAWLVMQTLGFIPSETLNLALGWGPERLLDVKSRNTLDVVMDRLGWIPIVEKTRWRDGPHLCDGYRRRHHAAALAK